jgi:hypothetical protein
MYKGVCKKQGAHLLKRKIKLKQQLENLQNSCKIWSKWSATKCEKVAKENIGTRGCKGGWVESLKFVLCWNGNT